MHWLNATYFLKKDLPCTGIVLLSHFSDGRYRSRYCAKVSCCEIKLLDVMVTFSSCVLVKYSMSQSCSHGGFMMGKFLGRSTA